MVLISWHKRRYSHLLNQKPCITWSILLRFYSKPECMFISILQMKQTDALRRWNNLSKIYLTSKPVLFALYLTRMGRWSAHTVSNFSKLSCIWWYIWEVKLRFNIFVTYSMFQIEWITIYHIIFIWSLYLSCLQWKVSIGVLSENQQLHFYGSASSP